MGYRLRERWRARERGRERERERERGNKVYNKELQEHFRWATGWESARARERELWERGRKSEREEETGSTVKILKKFLDGLQVVRESACEQASDWVSGHWVCETERYTRTRTHWSHRHICIHTYSHTLWHKHAYMIRCLQVGHPWFALNSNTIAVYEYMYIYIYIYIYTHTHTHIHTQIFDDDTHEILVYVYMYVHICMYICTYIYFWWYSWNTAVY